MYLLDSVNTNEYNIKGSKFITYIEKIKSLDMFKKQLNSIKNKHKDSSHVCYGYRIISKNKNLFNEPEIIEYSNDDGEPSGTAGKQILNLLKKENIINCSIFIVRYYH